MKPLKHQIEKANSCWATLLKYKYVYLQGLPRSGKTLTVLLTAEKSKRVKSVLILTTKNAIPGWIKFLKDPELLTTTLTKNYHVTNYEQIGRFVLRKESKTGKKLKKPVKELQLKLNPNDYELVILDESHRIGRIGPPKSRYLLLSRLCADMPHIHLSGTAMVESPNSIYYQMNISKYSPFSEFRTFYDYFRVFGQPSAIWLGNKEVPQYKLSNARLLPYVEKFTVRMTQEDAGIPKEVQATDKLHYIILSEQTKQQYNELQREKFLQLNNKILLCDTTMKLRTSLHMIEGGVFKVNEDYFFTGNIEKINYIKKYFGDTKDTGIMAHFIGERLLLEKHFKHAKIYSSTADAEGTDLSHLQNFIIYSSGYSGAKFIQRRDRIVNINQSATTIVHHLIVKDAISEQVYNTCSEKHNFNNETYKENYLK